MTPTTVDKQLLQGRVIHEPVLASTTSKAFSHIGPEEVTTLDNLTEEHHRARFQIIACTSGEDAIVEVKNGKKKQLAVQQQFLVRDTSTSQLNPKAYKVYHYTGGKHEDDLLYKDLNLNTKSAAKNIDKSIKDLKRFNVHLDAILERRGGAYFITNTQLKF